MKVRALVDVFLTGHGFRHRGETFNYSGPANRHLVVVPEDLEAPAVPMTPAEIPHALRAPRSLTGPEAALADAGMLPQHPLKTILDVVPQAPVVPVENPAVPVPTVSSVRLPAGTAPDDGSDLLG